MGPLEQSRIIVGALLLVAVASSVCLYLWAYPKEGFNAKHAKYAHYGAYAATFLIVVLSAYLFKVVGDIPAKIRAA